MDQREQFGVETAVAESLEANVEYVDEADGDQIARHEVVEQSGEQEDQHTRGEGDDSVEGQIDGEVFALLSELNRYIKHLRVVPFNRHMKPAFGNGPPGAGVIQPKSAGCSLLPLSCPVAVGLGCDLWVQRSHLPTVRTPPVTEPAPHPQDPLAPHQHRLDTDSRGGGHRPGGIFHSEVSGGRSRGGPFVIYSTTARSRRGIQGGPMGNPVKWFEVTGRDGDALQRFYSELFDWKLDTNNPMNYGVVDTGGGIGGGVGQTTDGSAGATTFYVETDDVAAHLKRAEAAGGSIVLAETEVMQGTVIGLLADPEGHLVGLLKAQPE